MKSILIMLFSISLFCLISCRQKPNTNSKNKFVPRAFYQFKNDISVLNIDSINCYAGGNFEYRYPSLVSISTRNASNLEPNYYITIENFIFSYNLRQNNIEIFIDSIVETGIYKDSLKYSYQSQCCIVIKTKTDNYKLDYVSDSVLCLNNMYILKYDYNIMDCFCRISNQYLIQSKLAKERNKSK